MLPPANSGSGLARFSPIHITRAAAAASGAPEPPAGLVTVGTIMPLLVSTPSISAGSWLSAYSRSSLLPGAEGLGEMVF